MRCNNGVPAGAPFISLLILAAVFPLLGSCGRGNDVDIESMELTFEVPVVDQAALLCCILEPEVSDEVVPARGLKIDARKVRKAEVAGDTELQVIEVDVGRRGLKPQVLVMERDIPAEIFFVRHRAIDEVSVYFPAYGQTKRFRDDKVSIRFVPEFDIKFAVVHAEGRFDGMVHVAADLDQVKKRDVTEYIENYIKITGEE